MDEDFFRDVWVEVDLNAIHHNIQLAKRQSNVSGIFAVVKANAYGHGDIEVSRVAIAAGCEKLCVATLGEALRLRNEFPTFPILITGSIPPRNVSLAAKHQIEITIYSLEFLKDIENYSGPPLMIHLKVDSGMNRLGFKESKDILEARDILRRNPNLLKVGLFTHYHHSEYFSDVFCKQQAENFEALSQEFVAEEFQYIHTANSAAMFLRRNKRSAEYGRLGILMYGLSPNQDITFAKDIRPAFSLHAKIVQVKDVKAGEVVGYSNGFVARKNCRIGILPIGYADGLWRHYQGLDVELDGRKFPIIGKVSMDQCMIEIDSQAKLGDVVTILGKRISIVTRAKELNTIPYELVCAISHRVPRKYLTL